MHAFDQLTSQAIPLAIDDVDTDMIIPAQFLTKIDREGYGQHVFQRLREQDSQFIFNDPYYQAAQILITQSNFGCGSSREHAVWALQQAGIKVIIAESYSDIFYNNAAKNGLLLITFAHDTITMLLQQSALTTLTLTVSLANQTVATTDGDCFHFSYDPFRKSCLLKGQDDLDYLLAALETIDG